MVIGVRSESAFNTEIENTCDVLLKWTIFSMHVFALSL